MAGSKIQEDLESKSSLLSRARYDEKNAKAYSKASALDRPTPVKAQLPADDRSGNTNKKKGSILDTKPVKTQFGISNNDNKAKAKSS